MRLSLTGRQIDVPPALRQLVMRRLERLERVFNDTLVSAQVVLSKERHLHQAELIIRARGDHTLSAVGGLVNVTAFGIKFSNISRNSSRHSNRAPA